MNGNIPRRALTLLETLVILASVIASLAIVLPAVPKEGVSRRLMMSQTNLRILGAAHSIYAADWNGRQLTFVDDFIATYGETPRQAFGNYCDENGFPHPGVKLGWGQSNREDPRRSWLEYRTCSNCANATLALPIEFTGEGCNPGIAYLGSFRLHNAVQFNQYVGGRFYDPVFYAPDDAVVIEAVDDGECFESSDGYCSFANVSDAVGQIPAWPSYCMSPAAMFNPAVFAHDDPDDPNFNGWVDPWSLDDGFESPGVAQALYPHLKSNMLEHHWLRNNEGAPECNPAVEEGTYGDDGCEPYYFNQAFASSPLTLFYDGHVGDIPVTDAVIDDAIVRAQNNPNWGLWSKDTPWGADGYLSEIAFDDVQTSFHILTTDGIRGRDILEPGGLRPKALLPAPHRIERARRSRRMNDGDVRSVRPSLTE